jgi:DNA segregation ATPase FtsK/SpoIIIE, S-DNA-T family
MALQDTYDTDENVIPAGLRRFLKRRAKELLGLTIAVVAGLATLAMASWSAQDPSLNHATDAAPQNLLGVPGAVVADQLFSLFGLGAMALLFIPLSWAITLISQDHVTHLKSRLLWWLLATVVTCAFLSGLITPQAWPIAAGLGGQFGDVVAGGLISLLTLALPIVLANAAVIVLSSIATVLLILKALDISRDEAKVVVVRARNATLQMLDRRVDGLSDFELPHIKMPKWGSTKSKDTQNAQNESPPLALIRKSKQPPTEIENQIEKYAPEFEDEAEQGEDIDPVPVRKLAPSLKTKKLQPVNEFRLPDLELLGEPKKTARGADLSADQLESNARALEGVLEDFGVKGQIVAVKPGPVVTLYELEPAPGIKSSRVISLADDIARSMSAISARVAVVQGRNAIGIELPNAKRETVYLREMFQTDNFENATGHLTVALGKNIGGEPIYADLARMPHLLIAGTTGSGKSVGINTLILSLLYRLPPERCKLIMIDPKMLELSVYEGIPHLLAPVVTDPKKAVVALKWAVKEMEERYKKMSKVGVRNLDGYNTRVAQLMEKGEKLTRTIQTGFDPETGQPTYEQEDMDTSLLPYIVVIIDEMADLMMVAGKDIEGTVQRLAQMARAAGIHVIMATQRPSVDVITGTIKANFPTRISFQVTSKIDSRTILSEMGAEQLLGQGDMLYMAGGGRISRLHGPFVSDGEVEAIVKHLKSQGHPDYVEAVTEEIDEEYIDGPLGGSEGGSSGDSLYDQAVAVVLRDKKVSTSYVQRRLQIGYNKAASLIERMEKEGLISGANATGKREILVPGDSARL